MRISRRYLGLIACGLLFWGGFYFGHGFFKQKGLDGLVTEWSDLYGRCVTSIETGAPLDVTGLEETPVLTGAEFSQTYLRARRWQLPEGKLAILESEYGPEEKLQRACAVELLERGMGLTKRSQSDILFAFLKMQQQKLDGGGYIAHELIQTSELYMVGFGPEAPNVNGCEVLFFIATDLEATTDYILDTKTAEKASPDCSGPSHF